MVLKYFIVQAALFLVLSGTILFAQTQQPPQQTQQQTPQCDTTIRQILFVIDVSGSMSGNRIFQAKKFAVKTVQQFSGRGITFGVLTFGGGCSKDWIQMEQPFTPNPDEAIRTINGLQLRGGTPLGPAIEEAYNEILKSPEPDNSRVILLNDGANNCGDVGEILARRKRDVPCVQFTAIGIELQRDESGRPSQAMADLLKLAAETKGQYVALEDAQELERVSVTPEKLLEYKPSPKPQPQPAPTVAAKPQEPVREPVPVPEPIREPVPEPVPVRQTEPVRETPQMPRPEPIKEPVKRQIPTRERIQFSEPSQPAPLQEFMPVEGGKLRVLVKDQNGNDVQGFVSFRDAASNALEMELFAHGGTCAMSVERGKQYRVSVDKPGYDICTDGFFSSSQNVSIDEPSKQITLYLCTPLTIRSAPQSSPYLSLPPLLFYVDTDILLPESANELRQLAPELRSQVALHQGKTFIVEGHTSDEGTPERNLRLSVMRAQAVVRALRAVGIPDMRIEWDGFGRLRPVADNSSEEGRRLNRRVEIRVKE